MQPFSMNDARREIERLTENENRLVEALNECREKLGLAPVRVQVPIRGMHQPD